MGTDDWPDWCHLPGGIFPGKFDRGCQGTALVHLSGSAFLLHRQSHNHCCSTGWGHPYCIWTLSHCIRAWAWASWLNGSRPFWWSNSSTRDSTSTSVFPTRHPLGRHSLGGAPFSDFLAIPSQGKWDHSPSSSPDHHHTKKLREGLNPALLGVTKTHWNWFQRLDLGPALNKEGKNLSVLWVPPVPLLVW